MRGYVGVLFWVCFGLAGCGVKGPPVAPRQPMVPVVVDLRYTLSGDVATLTWSLASPLSAKEAQEAWFVLFRSQTSFASQPCDTCPQLFEKVVTVPYTDPSSGRYTATILLQNGYRYLFKARLETKSGIGPDSNTVGLDFPSADDPGKRKSQ